MDNVLRRKVENDLKHQIEVRISFEFLRQWGLVGLGPILFIEQIEKLEELLGNDKRFYLENESGYLVTKYKDCIINGGLSE
jgi:hypothetical protein